MPTKVIVVNIVKLALFARLVVAVDAKLCEVNSTTATCNLLHKLQVSIDETMDPCMGFYEYACNKFSIQHNNIKFERTTILAEHQVNLKLITVMDTLYQQPLPVTQPNQSVFDKSFIYYNSCVNEKDPNVLRYLELIKPGLGLEWPLMEELQAYRRGDSNFAVNDWTMGQFDVFALLGQLQSYGLNDVLIWHNMFLMPEATLPVLTDILKSWGLPEEIALKYTEEIIQTEGYWCSLYQGNTVEPEPAAVSYTTLTQQFPYLSVFLDSIVPQDFRDNARIRLYNTKYFRFLLNKRWSAKEAQQVCNLLMLRLLGHLQADRAQDFSKLECIKDLRNKLDFPVNLLYYQYVYQPDELFYNREIYLLYNKTLHYTLDALDENHLNVTAAGLDQLRAQISSMSLNIGNLPRNLRTSQIEKFFRNIPPLELHNYYRNHLHLLRHRFQKFLLPLNNQTYSIFTDNFRGSSSAPFYDNRSNMIVLPFGMFQPTLYHHTYDPIFKWSSLGFQLAHTFSHAISRNALLLKVGHPFDGCLQELVSFGSLYTNFADVAGAHVAYRAYTNEQQKQLQPEFSKISWKKLFFLNLAQFFCAPEDTQQKNIFLPRLVQIARHMESFTEAFQCPVDSIMNPEEKCGFL